MLVPRPVLLMTRPRVQSDRFVASLPQALCSRLSVVTSPVIEIVPLHLADRPDPSGVIFTSRNGVEIGSDLIHDRAAPAYCVGEATTRAALARGWQAQTVGADAAEFLTRLSALSPPTPLLHLRGRHSRGAIAESLTKAGLPTSERVIYDQPSVPLTKDAQAALEAGSVLAPVFSPRSAAELADQIDGARDLHLLALSPAVAVELSNILAQGLHVCAAPNASEMRKLVIEQAGIRLRH